MADWTNATARPGVVLRPERLREIVSWEVAAPAQSVTHIAATYWSLAWSFGPGESHQQFTVPDVMTHLSVEWGDVDRDGVIGPGTYVTGPSTRRFGARLHGTGGVLGVKLQPGVLASLTGVPASHLRDRTVPAMEAWPREFPQLRGSAPQRADALNAYLAQFPQPADARVARVQEVVEHIRADRSITRVEQVAGPSVRALQRLFNRYLGVTPKWCILRSRIHDALAILDDGYDGSLTDLGASLGWYDQAHFIRDFRAVVGQSPGRYRARSASAPDGRNHASQRV